jgi:hypothetical protein
MHSLDAVAAHRKARYSANTDAVLSPISKPQKRVSGKRKSLPSMFSIFFKIKTKTREGRDYSDSESSQTKAYFIDTNHDTVSSNPCITQISNVIMDDSSNHWTAQIE